MKFYQRKWFTVLMFFVFFPVAIILMWANKHWSKTARIALTAIFSIILIVIIVPQPEDEDKPVSSSKVATTDEPTEKVEKKEAETPKEKEVEAQKVTISNVDLASGDFKKLVKKKFKDVKEVVQTDGSVVVTFKDDITYWDENDFVKRSANTGVALMEYIFKNPDVKSVNIVTPTTMTDSKGNESLDNVIKVTWDRELSDSVNYKNFKDMVLVEYPRYYNEAVTYYIHPGIYKNIKSDMKDLFVTGSVK